MQVKGLVMWKKKETKKNRRQKSKGGNDWKEKPAVKSYEIPRKEVNIFHLA